MSGCRCTCSSAYCCFYSSSCPYLNFCSYCSNCLCCSSSRSWGPWFLFPVLFVVLATFIKLFSLLSKFSFLFFSCSHYVLHLNLTYLLVCMVYRTVHEYMTLRYIFWQAMSQIRETFLPVGSWGWKYSFRYNWGTVYFAIRQFRQGYMLCGMDFDTCTYIRQFRQGYMWQGFWYMYIQYIAYIISFTLKKQCNPCSYPYGIS